MFSLFKKKPKHIKVFHIGYRKPLLKDTKVLSDFSWSPNGNVIVDYKFFNYLNLYQDDNIIGVWQRIAALLPSFQPDIILIEIKDSHHNVINDDERTILSKLAPVIELNHVERSHLAGRVV